MLQIVFGLSEGGLSFVVLLLQLLLPCCWHFWLSPSLVVDPMIVDLVHEGSQHSRTFGDVCPLPLALFWLVEVVLTLFFLPIVVVVPVMTAPFPSMGAFVLDC